MMNIKTYLTLTIPFVLCLFMSANVNAQEFNTAFSDSTLRIDYIFSGNANQQHIAVDQLNVMPRWYGKKQRLAELPMEGNGQITVRDHHTKRILYRNSFSTLFQEWLTYDEAKHTSRAFENVFLVPMPKDTVDITVTLNDNRRETTTQLTHTVAPNDILIKHIGERNRTSFETLQTAQDTSRCIHIAFLAEGYRTNEMDIFLKDAAEATEALFAHEPFKAMRNRFNIIAVKAPSADSGTSEPSKGVWKNTALHSHFDTFYSNRYLTTLRLKTVHDCLAGLPYEHIIILVNTHQYGGGGILNSYNLSMTHHPSFKPVVVHEFGHSFAGLADEYAYDFEEIPMYPPDIEPWEQNITTKVKFSDKWQDMMGKVPSVGLIEGAGYSLKGIYRASPDCRMRTNDTPEFCPVCQRAIQRVIDFYTK
ncbi:M64 family metallopeptidase [Hoylesella buccalis]|uniref:M64 family metallopeptidase n=1 Tax=Hoylesella buccalis TaxID=28127 RepID=UPI0039919BDC